MPIYRFWFIFMAAASFWGRSTAILRKQRLAPLEAHLKARDGLPAVRRLLVVPAGTMALVPLEALGDDRVVSYVPSGSVFARLTQRRRAVGKTLLAVGAPVQAARPEPPAFGVMLKLVPAGSNAARAGLRAGDVLLAVNKKRLESAMREVSGQQHYRLQHILYDDRGANSLCRQVEVINAAIAANGISRGYALLVLPERAHRDLHNYIKRSLWPNLQFQCALASKIRGSICP